MLGICQLSLVLGPYGKCAASELANAFCSCIYSALEVSVGPLATDCSCAGHLASSPAVGELDYRAALYALARDTKIYSWWTLTDLLRVERARKVSDPPRQALWTSA